MPKNLLIEFGFYTLSESSFEQLPQDLNKAFGLALNKEGFQFSGIKTWLSQHRIAAQILGITDYQLDTLKEIRGPKASVAYDLNNQPTPAASGFAAAQGLQLKDLIIKELDGEKFLFAKTVRKGQSLEQSIEKILYALIDVLSFKPWSKNSVVPQPLANMCLLIDDNLFDYKIENVTSTALIYRHEPQKIKIVDYPEIMKQKGLYADIDEGLANFEAEIKALLPQGALPRFSKNSLKKTFLLSENFKPVLISFENKYLDIPSLVIEKAVAEFFGFFVSEDKNGRLLPHVVMLVSNDNPTPEKETKQLRFNYELENIYSAWNDDVKCFSILLDKFLVNFDSNTIEEFSLPSIKALAEFSFWFLDNNVFPEANKDTIVFVLSLIQMAQKTKLAALFPDCALPIVLNRIKSVEEYKTQLDIIEQITEHFCDKISIPTIPEAKLLIFAMMFSQFKKNATTSIFLKNIAKFIVNSKIHIDILSLFTQLLPELRLDKAAVVKNLLSVLQEPPSTNLLSDGFVNTTQLDLLAANELCLQWHKGIPENYESLKNLYSSLKNKVEAITVIPQPLEEEIDILLAQKLEDFDNMIGINYCMIWDFFEKEKATIQASIMSLPPALDQDEPSLSAKVGLLQKVLSLLSKLPFLKTQVNLDD